MFGRLKEVETINWTGLSLRILLGGPKVWMDLVLITILFSTGCTVSAKKENPLSIKKMTP